MENFPLSSGSWKIAIDIVIMLLTMAREIR